MCAVSLERSLDGRARASSIGSRLTLIVESGLVSFHGKDASVPHTRLWRVRHFVTRFVNPVTRLFAGRAPGFGILTYMGRKTGRTYHTPVNVFRRDGDEYVFVLTYGSDAEWVKNVIAAGECDIRTRGHDRKLVGPELIVDPTRRLAPRPIRVIERLGGVSEFLTMHAAAPPV